MPVLTVRHVTTYRYRQPVAFGEHRMMFRPRESHDQRLLEAQARRSPRARGVRWLHDVFGNSVAVARFAAGRRSCVRERGPPRPHAAQPARLPDRGYARTFPFAYGAEEMPDLARSIERH